MEGHRSLSEPDFARSPDPLPWFSGLRPSGASTTLSTISSRVSPRGVRLRAVTDSDTVRPLLAPGCPRGPREGGANPPRPRHCNRGRNSQVPLAMSREGAGSRTIRKPGDLPGRIHLDRFSREDLG